MFQNSIAMVTGGGGGGENGHSVSQSVDTQGDVGPWGITHSGSLFIPHSEYAATATN